MQNFSSNTLYRLLKLSAVAIAVFTLVRTVLLIVSWRELPHDIPTFAYVYGVGFLYDLAFLSYFLLPFSLLSLLLPERLKSTRLARYASILLVFALTYGLLFTEAAEWFFWEEFNTRFNFISVDYLIYRQEVTENIYQSYPVVPLLALLAVLALAITWWLHREKKESGSRSAFSGRRKYALLALPLVFSSFSYAFINQSEHELSENNYANELASNGPYQFIAAYRNNELDYRQFYLTADDSSVSNALKQEVPDTEANNGLYNIGRHTEGGDNKKLNVVLISVESLSARYMTRFGNVNNITPFLDDLADRSLFFSNFYATGTRTTRGLESITLSVPPTPGRSLVKRPDNDHLHSIGEVFLKDGYDVAFLYGGRGYFDNMNSFFSGNGYRIVDQASTSDRDIEFSNAWGMADEDLYRIAIDEANATYANNEPFFFHIMTTSNHRPYTYPEGRIDIPSGAGRAGAVKYTDWALAEFLSQAEQQPWFDDTIFVIVADHCASSAGRVGLPVAKYHIPMFIYAPKHIQPREFDKLASQIDIAPTLLSLLGKSYENWFFGEDMLAEDFQPRALISNYQHLGLWKDDQLTILKPRQEVDVMLSPGELDILRAGDPESPEVLETLGYYQGADYILQHRLNRWQ